MREKNTSGKASPASIVIASICICLYLAALVFAIIKIYVHVERQRDLALDEFTYIADLACTAGASGFMDEQFIAAIQDALASSSTLEGLIITGPSGEYPFEKNAGNAISMVNNTPRFKNRIDFSPQSLYMPLRIQNLRNVNIEARAGAVNYTQVSDILKQTLLLVLISLMISFFTLLLQSLLDKSDGKRTRARQEKIPVLPEKIPDPPIMEDYSDFSIEYTPSQPGKIEEPTILGQEEPQKVAVAPQQRPAAVPQSGKPQQRVAAPAQQRPGAAQQQTQKPATEPSRTVQPADSGGPRGLYSPRGNIGWEDYIGPRLDSELLRCAANEQDMVYMVMEFKNLDVLDDKFYMSFANDAVEFFTMRDLIFELGEGGIAVILPNVDLTASTTKAKTFHERCFSKYSGVFKSQTDLCIGLSSRSGRLIDAERLIFEASEALKKALSDPVSHIIGFKSDPEKFRAYIASKKT